MKISTAIVCAALVGICRLGVVDGRAEEMEFYRILGPTTTVITAINSDGTLVWSNAAVGVTCSIQRATTLMGTNIWTDLAGVVVTSTVMATPGSDYQGDYMVIDLSGGSNATSYPVSYLTAVPAGGWTDEYKTTKLVLRKMPAGTFTMGSPTNELGRNSAETQHSVTLTQPFYLGVFEVTQKQWERVMGTWPSYFYNASYRDSRPVEQVSYNNIRGAIAGAGWPANSSVDEDSFMGRLRARTGLEFDLPTESQWEFAGRAGTTTALNSGYNLTSTESDPHMDLVGRYWFNGGGEAPAYTQNEDTSVATAKAGSYQGNAWRVYDIHGNVWEWCLDWYGTYPGTASDSRGATTGSCRVVRGGSCGDYGSNYCRLAQRRACIPDEAYGVIGFRAAVPPGQQ